MFVIAGAVLIISALLLMLYNEYVDIKAGEASEDVLAELRLMIDEKLQEQETASESFGDFDDLTDILSETEFESAADISETTPTKKTMTAGGYECIGYLDIPSLSLLLPIISDWDYARLNVAPCRHFGSVYTDDLVIAGHNYKRHFSYLSKLNPGDAVLFCDTDGAVHSYTVSSVEQVDASEVDSVKNSGHSLTLYTCTYFGNIRTVVFCDRLFFLSISKYYLTLLYYI